MFETDIINWEESIVLIAYPEIYGEKDAFIYKTNQVLDNLKDYLLVAIDDSKSYVSEYYPAHLLKTFSSKDITDKEVNDIVRKVTHSLIFWDGENHNKFIYQTFLQKIPHKIIAVQTTKVVNKDRGEDYDIYIGRRGRWGNPYVMDKDGDRDEVVAKYRKYFYENILSDPTKKKELLQLKGCKLGCHCKPLKCHGDIIAEYLNSISLGNSPDD